MAKIAQEIEPKSCRSADRGTVEEYQKGLDRCQIGKGVGLIKNECRAFKCIVSNKELQFHRPGRCADGHVQTMKLHVFETCCINDSDEDDVDNHDASTIIDCL